MNIVVIKLDGNPSKIWQIYVMGKHNVWYAVEYYGMMHKTGPSQDNDTIMNG